MLPVVQVAGGRRVLLLQRRSSVPCSAEWRRVGSGPGASGAQGCRCRISSHYAAALGSCVRDCNAIFGCYTAATLRSLTMNAARLVTRGVNLSTHALLAHCIPWVSCCCRHSSLCLLVCTAVLAGRGCAGDGSAPPGTSRRRPRSRRWSRWACARTGSRGSGRSRASRAPARCGCAPPPWRNDNTDACDPDALHAGHDQKADGAHQEDQPAVATHKTADIC